MSKRYGTTASQVNFSSAVHANIPRSVFRQNHSHKTTFNASELVPIFIQEVLPGDTFEIDMAAVVRTTTPVVPMMDSLYIQTHWFFVPTRLTWDGHEELHGENKSSAWIPEEPPAPVPCLEYSQNYVIPVGSLADYFGIPPGIYDLRVDGTTGQPIGLPISVLPFRAYGLIYNEWFRDQNYQAPIQVETGNFIQDEIDTLSYRPNAMPLKVNKRHDYFTSSLPAPQKSDGVLAVSVDGAPSSGYLPVVTRPVDASNPGAITINKQYAPMYWRNNTGVPLGSGYTSGAVHAAVSVVPGQTTQTTFENRTIGVTGTGTTTSLVPLNLWADFGGASLDASGSTTISELRTAFQLQRLFERDARGGTRYVEMLKAHFNVIAEDMRLQRPEFLGSWRVELEKQQVPQTSSTDNVTPQGNLASYSFTPISKRRCVRKSFVEHGYVIGLCNVRSNKTYQQGVERFWSRRDRFDFYYPALSHISEQPIFSGEIYRNDGGILTGNSAKTREVLSFQESWADLRYKPNRTSGYFRSGVSGSLDVWHLGSHFDQQPIMSASFLEDDTREMLDRNLVLPHTTAPQLLADFFFSNKATRPMPFHGVPGLVDHF